MSSSFTHYDPAGVFKAMVRRIDSNRHVEPIAVNHGAIMAEIDKMLAALPMLATVLNGGSVASEFVTWRRENEAQYISAVETMATNVAAVTFANFNHDGELIVKDAIVAEAESNAFDAVESAVARLLLLEPGGIMCRSVVDLFGYADEEFRSLAYKRVCAAVDTEIYRVNCLAERPVDEATGTVESPRIDPKELAVRVVAAASGISKLMLDAWIASEPAGYHFCMVEGVADILATGLDTIERFGIITKILYAS